jgi:hypothetical protein
LVSAPAQGLAKVATVQAQALEWVRAESVPVVEGVQPALRPETQGSMRLRSSFSKRHVIASCEFLNERVSPNG